MIFLLENHQLSRSEGRNSIAENHCPIEYVQLALLRLEHRSLFKGTEAQRQIGSI